VAPKDGIKWKAAHKDHVKFDPKTHKGRLIVKVFSAKDVLPSGEKPGKGFPIVVQFSLIGRSKPVVVGKTTKTDKNVQPDIAETFQIPLADPDLDMLEMTVFWSGLVSDEKLHSHRWAVGEILDRISGKGVMAYTFMDQGSTGTLFISFDWREGTASSPTSTPSTPSTTSKSSGSKKPKPEEIVFSRPSNFRHTAHMGWDPTGGFDVSRLPEEWKELFKKAGIRPRDLRDPETAKEIIAVIAENMPADAIPNTPMFPVASPSQGGSTTPSNAGGNTSATGAPPTLPPRNNDAAPPVLPPRAAPPLPSKPLVDHVATPTTPSPQPHDGYDMTYESGPAAETHDQQQPEQAQEDYATSQEEYAAQSQEEYAIEGQEEYATQEEHTYETPPSDASSTPAQEEHASPSAEESSPAVFQEATVGATLPPPLPPALPVSPPLPPALPASPPQPPTAPPAPKLPPSRPTGDSPSPGGAKTGLFADIQGGVKLNDASSRPIAPAPDTDNHGSLLDAIRAGKPLKKVDPNQVAAELPKLSEKDSNNLANLLATAMNNRRSDMAGDTTIESDDNDDWD